eukprot:scaffold1096_cov154-Skeletonema_menzelii.AAC.5
MIRILLATSRRRLGLLSIQSYYGCCDNVIPISGDAVSVAVELGARMDMHCVKTLSASAIVQ